MSRALQMEFVAAAVDVHKLPPSRAEVAFIGRSNVGKSSLINAIADRKALTKVSNKPGCTKVLTCFAMEKKGTTIVDCPGYGYAKVAKSTRASWLPMLESYLREREALRQAVLLVDGEIGPTESDLFMLGWLRENELPHTVVATKHDKVKPSLRHRRELEFAERCELGTDEVVWVSAHDNAGITRLRELVREWLA